MFHGINEYLLTLNGAIPSTEMEEISMNNCGKAFRKYTALFGLILTLSLTSSGTANASEMVSSAGKAEKIRYRLLLIQWRSRSIDIQALERISGFRFRDWLPRQSEPRRIKGMTGDL